MCQKTFSKVFALTAKRLQVLNEKKKSGECVTVEKRGNKTKNRKISNDMIKNVIAHIKCLPRESSHYSRNKTSKEYLSPDLNLNRLFLAFKKVNPNTIITYKTYSNIFKENFSNLSFQRHMFNL